MGVAGGVHHSTMRAPSVLAVAAAAVTCVVAMTFLRRAALDVTNSMEFARRSFRAGGSCHAVDLAGADAYAEPHTGHVDPLRLDEGPEHAAWCLRRLYIRDMYYAPAVVRVACIYFGKDVLGIASRSDLEVAFITRASSVAWMAAFGVPVLALLLFLRARSWLDWLAPAPAIPVATRADMSEQDPSVWVTLDGFDAQRCKKLP